MYPVQYWDLKNVYLSIFCQNTSKVVKKPKYYFFLVIVGSQKHVPTPILGSQKCVPAPKQGSQKCVPAPILGSQNCIPITIKRIFNVPIVPSLKNERIFLFSSTFSPCFRFFLLCFFLFSLFLFIQFCVSYWI